MTQHNSALACLPHASRAGTVITGIPDAALAPLATVVAPLVTLIGALVGAFLLYRATVGVARRNLLVGTITRERADWREDIRKAVSRLVAVAMAMPSTPTRAQMAEFDRLRVRVRLRLNPSRRDRDILDQQILAALKELRVRLMRGDTVGIDDQVEIIESRVQQLLKTEWDKSKDEARTGELIQSRD